MFTLVAAGATALSVAPAAAAPQSSSAEVSPATVAQGQTFTVTEQIYNSQDFTITSARAAIYSTQRGIADVADLVSCTGTTSDCYVFGSSFRGPVGDLPAGESRTVTFTFRAKDDVDPGTVALQTQLVGDNYALDTLAGPDLTITGVPKTADIGVSVQASPPGILTSKITYTITATNKGPGAATDVRLSSTYAPGLIYAGSTTCSRVGSTRQVTCAVGSLSSGAGKTVSFSVNAGLLALGPLTTTVTRQASTPADPNAANDKAAVTCHALTGLLVRC
ncbi:DUF11 domain-containing protein [Amycolatopsis acidiphila]|uniref:DUF11 domain-containing protein n=1 Tax=Amycolatopsis acidiphila TaxID=715473 RepID=A0A558A1K2_9PSEU|nr:DUF11 domain-containing protein [Amycolatopsis acidiphila]TVT18125.1 DUF11 domain-containing protein [Amycolatopsis acidiphila]UIJ61934.1 DUF11 domain-containing protein [Amycolatopsis acidiphila]GHG57068.1 hypothetical protein GCM10017788_08390 [Amycolatopsis acidiphila]